MQRRTFNHAVGIGAAAVVAGALAVPAIAQSAPKYWGVNLHFRTSGSYSTVPLATQLQRMKDMGLTHIRVDVYNGSAGTLAQLKTLNDAAKLLGLTVTPVFVEPTASAITSEAKVYDWCYSEARKLAQAFPAMWFEAANELNFKCIKLGVRGEASGDFDTPAYLIVRESIKGMIAGFKSASPQPVTVGTADIQFGFLDRLWADGVRPDVISWHTYVPSGTPLAAIQAGGKRSLDRLASFGQQIVVNEFNQTNGHLSTNSPQTMLDMMTVLGGDARVLASYLYELLDEPGLPGGEATYGLCDAQGNLNALGKAVKAKLLPA